MSDLPRVNAPGLKVWRDILLELLRREKESDGPPSVLALAGAVGKSPRQTALHLTSMEQAKFIEWDSRFGRHGSEVRLTEIGRLVARIAAADFN